MQGCLLVSYYLDDFLVQGRPGSDECGQAVNILLRVFKKLGIPVARDKLEGPVACLILSVTL